MGQAKVALVTGAGSGIGKHSVLALSRAGYSVVLAGRRVERLEEVAGLVAGEYLVVAADVGKAADVVKLFDKTSERFSRLDVLFNNAGVGAPSVPLEDLTLEQWQTVVDVNLTGAFLCTQQAFRLMKSQTPMGGRIINNGSISAHVPRPDSVPYTATKHAMTGLTRSTSLDGRKYHIVCGQIDIGNALTDVIAGMHDGVRQADGSVRPEPTMDIEPVANAVVQMADLPLASNIQFMTIMASQMPYIGRG